MQLRISALTVLLVVCAITLAQNVEPSFKNYINNHYQNTLVNTVSESNKIDYSDPTSLLPINIARTKLKSSSSTTLASDSAISYSYYSSISTWLESEKELYSYNSKGYMSQKDSYIWDYTENNYYNSSSISYTYDNNNYLLQYIYSNLDETTNQLVSFLKKDYSYDSNGNITLQKESLWDSENSVWINSTKKEYSFNTEGKQLLYSSYNWDETASLWIGEIKTERTFSDENNLTQKVIYSWDYDTNDWYLSYKYFYEYNEYNNLTIEQGYSYYEYADEWNISTNMIYEYTYDENGKVILYMSYSGEEKTPIEKNETIYNDDNSHIAYRYSWDSNANDWLNNSKTEYAYNNNGLMTLFCNYEWDEDTEQWDGEWKQIYEFDDNGNETLGSSYSWDDSINDWYGRIKTEFIFDTNENLVEMDSYNWDYDAANWIYSYKLIYYYSEHVFSNISQTQETQISLYPNPTTSNLTVTFTEATTATLELYNLQGAKVLSKQVNSNAPISLDDLEQGIYLYKLNINGEIQSGKIVKE